MEKELREIFNKNNVGFGEIDVDNAVKDILRLFSVSNSANTDDYTKGYRDGWRDCHKDQNKHRYVLKQQIFKIMTEKDILKLVEETFGEEISTSCAETILGLESWIDGKEAFMEKLTEKLKLLFHENDLSK